MKLQLNKKLLPKDKSLEDHPVKIILASLIQFRMPQVAKIPHIVDTSFGLIFSMSKPES